MPRTRRDWSVLRANIRRVIREQDAATSYWEDDDLLQFWNEAMDQRVMELADQHEGWVTAPFITDIVTNQSEYTVPEGSGRIKRVLRRFNQGGGRVYIVPLMRDERWSTATWNQDIAGGRGILPTYRLVGNKIILEPAPSESETDGLGIDLEFAPDRFVNDTDTLDPAFPDVMETLLVYDTAVRALAVELSQGNVSEGFYNTIAGQGLQFATAFFQYTSERSFGRSFSTAFNLGD